MKKFAIGDIVSHISGHICNGKYGEIVLTDWDNELMVLDNEGALDMPVKGNEDFLTVIGNKKSNPELLEEFI